VQLGHQVLALLKNDFSILSANFPAIRISTNASATELNAPNFAKHFTAWLHTLPTYAAQHLTLEVTETSLMQLSDAAITHLHNLRSLGICIAIDDSAKANQACHVYIHYLLTSSNSTKALSAN